MAVAEVSNVLMAIGVILSPLPSEAERILAGHFRRFYSLGLSEGNETINSLKVALSAKNLMIRKLEDDMEDVHSIIRAIRKGTL